MWNLNINSIWIERALDYSIIRAFWVLLSCHYQRPNWHFLRWIANRWWRIRGHPTASWINLSANRLAAVKATGNYKSRKRKQRKDELLISPGVILALDPRYCSRPVITAQITDQIPFHAILGKNRLAEVHQIARKCANCDNIML